MEQEQDPKIHIELDGQPLAYRMLGEKSDFVADLAGFPKAPISLAPVREVLERLHRYYHERAQASRRLMQMADSKGTQFSVYAASFAEWRARDDAICRVAENLRMSLKEFPEEPLTNEGTCWACGEWGWNLIWWWPPLEQGSSNEHATYLIHRTCTDLALTRLAHQEQEAPNAQTRPLEE